eukprot:TRINITY_DN1549_c0_g1_i1.p1 TRINITY_DN1549_c0_g1~~TRINITY_DN1549_c0_g1_i1.p1  ORF type:complete len:144 (-),score=30.04 TRINITY_DN1549_c0_g1_i1:24-455(-)
MKILASSLNGGYVNFGVFKLYNDRALSIAISTVLRLVLSIKLEVLLSYKKIARVYYQLMEVLFKNHCEELMSANSDIIGTILSSLLEGIQSVDNNQSSLAAQALDNFVTWKWNQSRKRNPSDAVKIYDQHFQANQHIIQWPLV